MELLILGMVIWSGAHLLPVALPDLRNQMAAKVGEMPYKGIFSLVILSSVAFIIFGWRSIESVTPLYDIYDYTIFPALFMMLGGLVLMVSALTPNNFKRVIRHPQLMGFALWAFSHVLINGELRTTILFGGFSAWALLSIVLINKRDGAFDRPEPVLPHHGVMTAAIAFVLFIAVVLGHEYLSGVDLKIKHQ